MRNIILGSIIALGVTAVSPVMAQGVFISPNGVGVGVGIHHNRDYDRDRDYRRGDRDGYYEGRSAYPGYGAHSYRDGY